MSTDPADLGKTCHFDSETSSGCGKCIASKCQDTVNACCGDSSCRDALSLLDRCAAHGGRDCTQLRYGDRGDSDAGAARNSAQKLGDCIATSCVSCLAGSESRPPDDPNVYCYVGSNSCDCTYGSSPNDNLCDETTIDNSVCCKNFGWPDRTLRCECRRFACKETTAGCECNSYGDGNLDSCAKKASGHHCCAGSSSCKCTAEACISSIEVEVTACTKAAVQCDGDEQKTTRCN